MKRHLSIAKRLLVAACFFLSLSGNASPETSSDVGRRDYNIEVAAGSDPATFIPVTEIQAQNQALHSLSQQVFMAMSLPPSLQLRSSLRRLIRSNCRA